MESFWDVEDSLALLRVEAILSALSAGVVIHARDTSVVFVSSKARDLFDAPHLVEASRDGGGMGLLDAKDLSPLPQEQHPAVQALAGSAVNDQPLAVRLPDGAIRFLHASARPLQGPSGEVVEVVVAYRDVTSQEQAERATQALHAELERICLMDPLTGLYNRRGVLHEAERSRASSLRHAEPFALMIVDLDKFKTVNDRYGHQRGDELLVNVADAMSAELRLEDSAGRIGGDEFLVVLPKTSATQAQHLAHRLRSAIAEVCGPYGCSASIGLSTRQDGESIAQTLSRADHALYNAKSEGGDTVRPL